MVQPRFYISNKFQGNADAAWSMYLILSSKEFQYIHILCLLGTHLTLFQSLVKKYVCKDYSVSLSYAYNIMKKKFKIVSALLISI